MDKEIKMNFAEYVKLRELERRATIDGLLTEIAYLEEQVARLTQDLEGKETTKKCEVGFTKEN